MSFCLTQSEINQQLKTYLFYVVENNLMSISNNDCHQTNTIKKLIKETVDSLKKYECKEFGKGDKLVIVIGEHHNILDEYHFQEKTIKYFIPDYILLELLHGVNYNPKENKISFRDKNCIDEIDNESDKIDIENFKEALDPSPNNHTFSFYKYISNKCSIPIIGCDLTIKEQEHYPSEPPEIVEKAREYKMIEIINTYLEGSSKLIVIMGNTHAKHIYENNKELKNATYLFILFT